MKFFLWAAGTGIIQAFHVFHAKIIIVIVKIVIKRLTFRIFFFPEAEDALHLDQVLGQQDVHLVVGLLDVELRLLRGPASQDDGDQLIEILNLRVVKSTAEERAGGGDDGGVAEVAGLAGPEDGVTQGLVTVQSVHHVLVEVVTLQLHIHLQLNSAQSHSH